MIIFWIPHERGVLSTFLLQNKATQIHKPSSQHANMPHLPFLTPKSVPRSSKQPRSQLPQVTKRIGPHHHFGTSIPFITKLLGGWTTHLKNMQKSNWIMSPRIGVKITKVFDSNHQPVSVYFIIQDSFHEKTLPDPKKRLESQIACIFQVFLEGFWVTFTPRSRKGMLREVNKNDYPP